MCLYSEESGLTRGRIAKTSPALSLGLLKQGRSVCRSFLHFGEGPFLRDPIILGRLQVPPILESPNVEKAACW